MARISDQSFASLSRRALLIGAVGSGVGLALAGPAFARSAGFDRWVHAFRARAAARGISAETYDRVMGKLEPDTSVYEQFRKQPEVTEERWQYINRRCSDWRVITGKQRAKEHAALLARLEKDYGVDRYALLGLWGMESSYGDVIDNPKYMRPVIPALAALAYGEPRRRKYWEAELLNALTIVDRKWAQPAEMIGSWAGAMGHTQWMPEVWLHVGVDYDRDGRANPFGKPDDALDEIARRRQRLCAARRPGQALAAGVRRTGFPRRTELPRGLFLQSVGQLHPGARSPRRSDPRQWRLPSAIPRRRAHPDH